MLSYPGLDENRKSFRNKVSKPKTLQSILKTQRREEKECDLFISEALG